ncbi:hypothetical protein ACFRAQ_16435 [Nocardia sp. NPDC056611]|uniref:hypothetical protein n=1 Tax=Nocardia sp. NPDC056611 TaxID=3345877 RepID=UPI00366AD60A
MANQHTAKYRAVTAATMAALALSAGVLPVCDAVPLASAQVLHTAPATEAQTQLYAGMRSLWNQHMDGTWAVVVAFANDPVALVPSLAGLLSNQVDIGNAFAPYYGRQVASQLTGLLTIHILDAVPVLTAARINSQPAPDAAVANWQSNARDIADFLAGINPSWPQ